MSWFLRKVRVSVFHTWISSFSGTFCWDCPFSNVCFWHTCQKLRGGNALVYFCIILFCFLFYLTLFSYTHLHACLGVCMMLSLSLWCHTIIWGNILWWSVLFLPGLFWLLLVGPLCLHIKFKTVQDLQLMPKQFVWGLCWIHRPFLTT